MVLTENVDVKSERNGPTTNKMKHVKNGKTKKGINKQNNQVRQGVNGRCENSGLNNGKSEEKNIVESSISRPNIKKKRQHKEMSLHDLYDDQNLFDDDDDDDDDDSDWGPAENHIVNTNSRLDGTNATNCCNQNCENERQHEEMNMHDIYGDQNLFADDDDDSDWEPVEKHVEVRRWICTNCTMVNFNDTVHCDICSEHKDSGILKHGFFASPLLQDAYSTDLKIENNGTHTAESPQITDPSRSTAIGYDERMLLHYEAEMKSNPHPERPDRIQAIAVSLATAGIFPGRCHPITAREITKEELQMVHSLEHIEDVDLTGRIYASYFTPDTYANEHSACAARLAAGLSADLASAIVSGRVKNGFALVRPPGHHAGVRQAMGFCLHNNAAVAALAAQAAGARKVLIVDWDVHHGNGTQEIFDQNKSVLYLSLHRHEGGKFYPGTGAADEVGTMGAEGYCVNVPWSRGGVGDNDYVFAFEHIVLPVASEFAPDLTIISAGFDAARGDPLGCCDVTPTGYAKMTEMLNEVSGGKLLVILEGGYNLRSISSSATAVIKVLLGERSECEVENNLPSKSGLKTVLEVLAIQTNYWPNLRPVFANLQSQWGSYTLQNKRKQMKKRRQMAVPYWWRWGRKSTLYHLLTRAKKTMIG